MSEENITVILSYYNESKTLPDTLDLLRRQTLLPKEVIFVNSGSTDDSSALIDKWVKENCPNGPVQFRNLNEGTNVPGSSMNVGVRNARCELLAFMDCGLLFEINWLETQFRYMKEYNAPLVYGMCYFEGDTPLDKAAIAQAYGYKRKRPTIPSTLVKKSVFDVTGLFLENRRAGFDVEWAQKLVVKKIQRCINPDAVIRYNGLNYTESFSHLFRKIVSYSEASVGVMRYTYPVYYVVLFIFLIFCGVFSRPLFLFMCLAYAVLRGYVIPSYKSRGIRLFLEEPRAFFFLPVVGVVMDAAKLVGYFKGFVKGRAVRSQ